MVANHPLHETARPARPLRPRFVLWERPSPLAASSSKPSAPEGTTTIPQSMPQAVVRPKERESGLTFLAGFVRPHLHSDGTPVVEDDLQPVTDATTSSGGPFVNCDTSPPVRPASSEYDGGQPDASTLDSSPPLTPFRQWMNGECPFVTVPTIEYREEVLKKSDSWAEFSARCKHRLDDDDIDAVLMYTLHSLYLALNVYLRVGTEEQKAVRHPWADQLQVALRKLPQFTGTVFRILQDNCISAGYTRGTEVEWPAFTSCSTVLSSENVNESRGKGCRAASSSTLVIHVSGAPEVGPLNPFADDEILPPAGWSGHVVDAIDCDEKRNVRGLAIAKKFTFIEFQQKGGSAVPDNDAADKEQDLRSSMAIASLHHFSLPSFARDQRLASEQYQRAIALDPNNTRACSNYAQFLTEVLKKHEKAAQFYEHAIALNPNNAKVCSNYAVLLTDVLKRHEKAADYFERAIKLDPNDAIACIEYADLLKNLRQHEKAGEFYERANILDPNDAIACNNYANLLTRELKQHEKAGEYYKRVIGLDPNNAKVCSNYAVFLTGVLKRHEKAGEYFERAIRLDPNNASACNNYANLLTDILLQHHKAADFYERAILLDPNYAVACNNYANLLTDVLERYEKAAQFYERAIELDPNNSDACNSYADLLTDVLEQHEKAGEYYKRAIRLDSNNARACICYAMYLTDVLKQHEKAAEYRKRGIALDPSYAHS